MMMLRTIATVVALAFALPAAAQFDPTFNHLQCYKIKGQPVVKTLMVENQFGLERIVKLKPVMLCTPARKTCWAVGTTTWDVEPVGRTTLGS